MIDERRIDALVEDFARQHGVSSQETWRLLSLVFLESVADVESGSTPTRYLGFLRGKSVEDGTEDASTEWTTTLEHVSFKLGLESRSEDERDTFLEQLDRLYRYVGNDPEAVRAFLETRLDALSGKSRLDLIARGGSKVLDAYLNQFESDSFA